MFKIAIIEDEAKFAAELDRHIRRYEEDSKVECAISTFNNAMDFISDYRPIYDLILMDIKMPHMNGLEAARRLRKIDKTVCLIFITSMAKYAIEGYEVGALDFIVKPVDYFNLSVKLQKAQDYISRTCDKEIFVPIDDSFHRVSVRDIYYIEVMGHALIYHLIGGNNVTTHGQLAKLESELKGSSFCRCNKCYLVNLNHVTAVLPGCIVVGGDKLLVSRRRKKNVLSSLADYFGGVFGMGKDDGAEDTAEAEK